MHKSNEINNRKYRFIHPQDDKSWQVIRVINSDAVKPCDGWENRWYYLEQFMSSWWVKMKQELLAVFLNCFTLIEVWQLWVECKSCKKSCKKWILHLKISVWYYPVELVPLKFLTQIGQGLTWSISLVLES